MERQKIFDAFDNITLSEESANRMLDNILASASEISPTGKDGNMKKISRKPVLIAAVIVIMLLTMGAVVVKLSVNDLHMGEIFTPGYTITNKDGTEVTFPEVTRDRISLQGVQDSPNFKASQEWHEFTDSYDTDYTLLHEADANGFVRPEEYEAYGVYTQEMIDKVDEIAEKYGLKLAGPITVVQNWEKEIFFDTLGIERLHREDAEIEINYLSGYFYECGNFKFEYDIKDIKTGYSFLCSTRYNGKEYFDTVSFSVDDIDTLEQWNYKTSDGNDVLIIHCDNCARILCDRDDAFISVRVSRYDIFTSDFAPITKEEAAFIADSLDFNVKPQV